MNVRYSSIAGILESLEQRQNIQILARCIGTALNLGSPLKITVRFRRHSDNVRFSTPAR